MAKEYSPNFYNQNIHRITVDTFAAQHPGKSERRAVQSVNGHLISLYCIFEKKLSGKQATEILKRAVEDKNVANKFLWLDPPDFEKTKHVTDVLIAKSLEEHERLVQAWGDSTWQAWKRKHIQAIESFIVELRV